MLPLLALADDLTADVRLKAAVTIGERYLPLPEFAKRLSAATSASIAIAQRMSERKLVLYVDGRPAAETMTRVADALGAHWNAQPGGWRLTSDPAIDAAERKAPAAREAIRRRAVTDWVAKIAAGPVDAKDFRSRAIRDLLHAAGPAAATETLLRGKAVVGTSDGRAGTASIDLSGVFAGVKVRQLDGTTFTPTEGMVLLRLDPETGRVLTTERSLGNAEAATGTLGWVDPLQDTGAGPDELDRLDDAWAATGDKALLETPLKPLAPEKDPCGVGFASLADLLARLHARTGLPVVAESFRAPVTEWGDRGGTVGEATRRAVEGPMIHYGNAPRFVLKGTDEWLLARTPKAWSVRRGEIPESRLVLLERKKTPTLDDFAALAGSLTEPQRAALEYYRPLASFPTVALRKGYWGLFVYDALPAELRSRAAAGLAFAAMPPEAQARWRRAVVDQVDRAVPPDAWVDAVLNDRIPGDAGFQMEEGSSFLPGYDLGVSLPEDQRSQSFRYHSVTFRFGAGTNPVTIDAPLAPVVP